MLIRILNRLEEGIISLLLVGMVMLVFTEVVMRFGFNAGYMWTQELTLHISAWMVLFGASYGLKVGAHIGVDTFVNMLPEGLRRWVSMFAVSLCLLYCGLFVYGAWIYLSKMYMVGIELEDLPIERWEAHSILLFGFILLGVRLFQLLLALARGQASGFGFADEAKEVLDDAKAKLGAGEEEPAA